MVINAGSSYNSVINIEHSQIQIGIGYGTILEAYSTILEALNINI